jgi:hypothetical protein
VSDPVQERRYDGVMSLRLCCAGLAALLAACVSNAREPFSVDALAADAPAYVAARYEANELPAALIAELTAEEFQCQHSAAMSQCGRARHAFASCWDVVDVSISLAGVQASQNRRCMGAQP